MSLVKEFKEFAMRGNVVDMAVGVVIGGAFGKVVSSFLNDVVMPPLGMLTGGVDFTDKAVTLKPAAEAAGSDTPDASARGTSASKSPHNRMFMRTRLSQAAKAAQGAAAAAEIESDDLRVEKVIPAGETATLRVRPAKPGQYKVVNEFKESVSGVIIAE